MLLLYHLDPEDGKAIALLHTEPYVAMSPPLIRVSGVSLNCRVNIHSLSVAISRRVLMRAGLLVDRIF